MSKHRLSPVPLPPSKRLHTLSSSTHSQSRPHPSLTFDNALFDELILVIFAHLSWVDLCKVQAINRNWARLATDNQVHKLFPLAIVTKDILTLNARVTLSIGIFYSYGKHFI